MAANDNFKGLAHLLCDTVRKKELGFVSLWKRIGLSERQIQQRSEDMNKHLTEMLEAMLEEDQENEQRIIGSIEKLCKEEFMICKELGMEPLSFSENEGLLSIESRHRSYLTMLQERKEEIMFEVLELISEDEILSVRLEVQPFAISKTRIPSPADKAALKDHIRQLSSEVQLRIDEFKRLKLELAKLFEELEMAPRTSAEVEILTSDIAQVKLSSSKMQYLKDLHEELATRASQNKRRFAQLEQQIIGLWDRLGIDTVYQERILRDNRIPAPSCIANLTAELQRCEELKRQNMKMFISKIRGELVAAWDKCYVGTIEREDFVHFHSELLTDELLAIHEMEVEKYREFYEANREIFIKIEKRNNLWGKMKHLEAISKDPGRLFANRGCKLLQEEKERKKIQLELPRVEGELVHMLNHYESTHGQPMKIHGEDFRLVIERQWEEYQEEKENEKQKRLKEKQEKLEEERRCGSKIVTPVKRRFAAGTTLRPETASPRAKRKCPTSTTASASGVMLTRHNLRSLAQSNTAAAAAAAAGPFNPNDTVATTYSVFSARIEGKSAKENCLSSPNSPPRYLPSNLASAGISGSPAIAAAAAAGAAASLARTRSHLRRSKSNPVLNASPLGTPGKNPKSAIPRKLRPFL